MIFEIFDHQLWHNWSENANCILSSLQHMTKLERERVVGLLAEHHSIFTLKASVLHKFILCELAKLLRGDNTIEHSFECLRTFSDLKCLERYTMGHKYLQGIWLSQKMFVKIIDISYREQTAVLSFLSP